MKQTKAQHYSNWKSSENRQHELTDEEVKRLHAVLLEMYKEIKEVCDRHKIHLIAGGGTALGAVRHRGFIPWDDDMDLIMFRSEYERFKKIFKNELSERYYLLAPGSPDGANCFFPRIVKKGTLFLSMIDEKSPYPHGIYIDVNILEYAPEGKAHFFLKGIIADVIRFISYSVYWNQYRSDSLRQFMLHSQGRGYYRVRMLIGRVFSFLPAEKWFSIFDRFIQNKKTSVFTVPSGAKKYMGERIERETILPLAKMAFEDTSIGIFHGTDAYLTNMYGDYMAIPKEKEHHLCLSLDFDHED